jgi:diaminopimelate decarboxylase
MELSTLSTHQTPFYYYNMELLAQTLQSCSAEAKKYNFHVHYALKANANPEILKSIVNAGFGADCVSGNEVLRAKENGFANTQIVFAGVGKSDQEINDALDADISCFNVESKQELEVLNELAAARNKIASIALRINPNVNAHTHHYITTGLEENKFGINHWELEKVIELLGVYKNIKLVGLHFHIGSQITDMSVFKSLCLKVNEFVSWFEDRKQHIRIINMGGGLGIDYVNPEEQAIPDFESYFKLFNQFLTVKNHQEVHFELGRALVAQCGTLISKVLYIKEGLQTNFTILDAGMTELLRPALYQAYHKIENLSNTNTSEKKKYDVVGPICESSDCFGKAVELPITKRGDYIAIRSAGAYGEVMRSGYNLRVANSSVFVPSAPLRDRLSL